ncbi:transketolase [Atractiella rhizophila]|nr:transketolase [Atractiella rhizophila]
MTFTAQADDKLCINTVSPIALPHDRTDRRKKPAPMGMAPVSHVLFSRLFTANPKNPHWLNRDRFVLSNGHACALQYTMLHLLGYKVSMDDLKKFRSVDSITPGHPELGVTEGIEVTTGPLGQGFANSVGLAIAQAHLGATYNKPDFPLITNKTFVFLGDGCMQEGVASEAASLAGHLGLGNLIAVYDDNQITIDGDTHVSFTENVSKRFEGYGWRVLEVQDGDHDLEKIYESIKNGVDSTENKPTLIRLHTTIGFGSKKQGSHDSLFGFDPEATFAVDQKVYDVYHKVAEKGAAAEKAWKELFAKYQEKYPNEAAELSRRYSNTLPEGWEKKLPTYTAKDKALATRQLSQAAISSFVDILPETISGSADLTPSNLTNWKGVKDFQPPDTKLGDFTGRYFRYGVREHGMGAVMNGIAAYGNGLIIPMGGTFLNFTSYAAGAIRLSALSHLRVIWVATHDSIGLGEDGPTHQPVEVVAHWRALPNCNVWRPADGNEVSAAYISAISSVHTPSILCLSRQAVPQIEASSVEKALKGGYVVHEAENADLTFVSTGTEVSLVCEAREILQKEGLKVRVVSLPCWEVFEQQSHEYKLSVFPDGHPVYSVEPYSTQGWQKYSHAQDGINRFGMSGPYKDVYKALKLTGPDIAEKAKKAIAHYKGVKLLSPINTQFDLAVTAAPHSVNKQIV